MISLVMNPTTIGVGDTLNFSKTKSPRFGKVVSIKPATTRGKVRLLVKPIA